MDEKDRMLKDMLSKETIEQITKMAMPLSNPYNSYATSPESTNKIDQINTQLSQSNCELQEAKNRYINCYWRYNYWWVVGQNPISINMNIITFPRSGKLFL